MWVCVARVCVRMCVFFACVSVFVRACQATSSLEKNFSLPYLIVISGLGAN